MTFTEPFDDNQMTYSTDKKRYTLTADYVSNMGIDLSLILNTEQSSIPELVSDLFLDRVSLLVYNNIYSYGREKKNKQYLLACDPELRDVIRDAMMERIAYIVDSGDMSTKTGALIQQGTRVEVGDLVASPQELNILRSAGILHRGKYYFIKDDSITY